MPRAALLMARNSPSLLGTRTLQRIVSDRTADVTEVSLTTVRKISEHLLTTGNFRLRSREAITTVSDFIRLKSLTTLPSPLMTRFKS